MTDTRQALAARLQAWQELAEWANGGWNLPAAATEKLRKLCDDARAALSAQPVEGAVAQRSDAEILVLADKLFPMWREDIQSQFVLRLARAVLADATQAAPAPEPSAQGEPPRFFDLLFELAQTDHISDRGITVEAMQQIRAALASAPSTPPPTDPIDMVLHCPACGLQHIDAPDERTPDWKNEPHRSHLCHGCGHIWRPADVPTNGVQATKTKGKADSPPPAVVEAVPLNFDKLQNVMSQHFGGRELTDDEADSAEAFARAIERAHGIAPKAAQEPKA